MVMIEKIWGYIIDAIRPWRTRKRTSCSPDCDRPHSADAIVKPVTPMMNMRLRPTMSPSRPPVMSITP